MTKKERIQGIIEALDQRYGRGQDATLDHSSPWELLVATMLSAQCTDARVNMVTPDLFRKYPSVNHMAEAVQSELEDTIRSIGFYRAKAKNLIGCAKMIRDRFGGEVPASLEELTSLPGVGRKTANVIRGHIFNDPSIVVDTHVKRISGLLGLTKSDKPEEVEKDLMRCLPREDWIDWNVWLITLGREICIARRPRCSECPWRNSVLMRRERKVSGENRRQ